MRFTSLFSSKGLHACVPNAPNLARNSWFFRGLGCVAYPGSALFEGSSARRLKALAPPAFAAGMTAFAMDGMTPLECARFLLCLFESTIAMSLRDSVGVWLVIALSTVLCLGRPRVRVLRQKRSLVLKMALGCSVVLFAAVQYTQGYLMQAHPSWWYHPFAHLWGWRAVECTELEPALRGLCATKGGAMCLPDGSWDLLSGGALSPKRSDDVRAVEKGVTLAATSTLVVAALARDIIGSVAPFRLNVEALVPFWKAAEVVVFENDSVDGTREALAAWAAAAVGYTVRVIECEESPGCRLKHGTWYHSNLKQNQLASYRNRLLDDVICPARPLPWPPPPHLPCSRSPRPPPPPPPPLAPLTPSATPLKPPPTQVLLHTTDPKAHLLVMDVDLGVSISPLGVLHTLGVRPLAAVAASGRSPKPTSVGSLVRLSARASPSRPRDPPSTVALPSALPPTLGPGPWTPR